MNVTRAESPVSARMPVPDRTTGKARAEPDRAVSQGSTDRTLRRRLGEFVGNVFYGTLIRQMHASRLKGEYFHGGRGEGIFQAQLGMELAQRMGRAAHDPIANALYRSLTRNTKQDSTSDTPQAKETPSASEPVVDGSRGEP